MNPRHVLAMAVVLLLVVSELASEGGPIDSLAQPEDAATLAQAAPPARPAPRTTGSASDFFANYEPPESDEGWPVTARASAPPALANAPTATPLGALPFDRLGVEMPSPTGIAPDFVPG